MIQDNINYGYYKNKYDINSNKDKIEGFHKEMPNFIKCILLTDGRSNFIFLLIAIFFAVVAFLIPKYGIEQLKLSHILKTHIVLLLYNILFYILSNDRRKILYKTPKENIAFMVLVLLTIAYGYCYGIDGLRAGVFIDKLQEIIDKGV